MKAVLQNKRRASAPLCVCLLLAALLLTFPFLPASAAEPEGEAAEGAQEELLGNIEEMLGGLDTDALQSYLDSLTEAQREAFGGSVTDKIMAVISGDYAIDYESALGAIGGLVFDGLIGMLPAFCSICAVAILCGLLGSFRSSFAEGGTSPSCAGCSAASAVRLQKGARRASSTSSAMPPSSCCFSPR